MATVSAREFNQDVGAAKRAAAEGPVIITDRGRPSHVLLTIDDYRRLTGRRVDLVDWLAMEGRDHRVRSGACAPGAAGSGPLSYLLDTNVVSELRKPRNQANRGVQDWARSQAAETLFLSVITVLELEIGVASMERRDPHQGQGAAFLALRKGSRRFRRSDRSHRSGSRAAGGGATHPRPAPGARRADRGNGHGPRATHRYPHVKDSAPMGVNVVDPWS